jgi:hypothetical protein
MISGMMSIVPNTNEPTMTYGFASRNFLNAYIPIFTGKTVTISISNTRLKAINKTEKNKTETKYNAHLNLNKNYLHLTG